MSEYGSDASITGSLIVDGESDIGSGDDDVDLDAGTLFVDAAQDRVGVGTDSPAYELHVAGDMGVDEYIYHNGDADTFIRFETDQITAKAGNVSFINITEDDSQDKISFNEGRADVDFIVRSPSNALALYLNAGNEVFHINHNETGFKTKIHSTNGEAITVDSAGVVLNEDGAAANDFRVESDNNTHLLFADGGNDNIGIGTSSPSTSAILEISSSSKGVMLPRITAAAKPSAASALNGLMIYEEDTHLLRIVANGEWKTVSFED